MSRLALGRMIGRMFDNCCAIYVYFPRTGGNNYKIFTITGAQETGQTEIAILLHQVTAISRPKWIPVMF